MVKQGSSKTLLSGVYHPAAWRDKLQDRRWRPRPRGNCDLELNEVVYWPCTLCRVSIEFRLPWHGKRQFDLARGRMLSLSRLGRGAEARSSRADVPRTSEARAKGAEGSSAE